MPAWLITWDAACVLALILIFTLGVIPEVTTPRKDR